MSKNVLKADERPWGNFETLLDFEIDSDAHSSVKGKDLVVKKITVKPGECLSYQSHKWRRETWVFVQGRGLVIKDDLERWVSKGVVVEIRPNMKHRAINNSNIDLIFIEISEGKFDEKDIVRYADKYNRHESKKKS